VIYNCAGTPASRWLNFGTLLTSNPSLNAYNYTTTPSYLSSASDGKAIGFAPKLKVLVGSEGNVSTIANNATLQMTAVVTDSLSAFSPTVTWTTNSTQGSTIDASTGLFTAGNIDEAGIVITASTAYGYVGIKTITVGSPQMIGRGSKNEEPCFDPKLSIVNSSLLIQNIGENATIRVFDILGHIIITKTEYNNYAEIKLNSRGIYVVSIQSGTNVANRKVIF
jgi:hypothetical protein